MKLSGINKLNRLLGYLTYWPFNEVKGIPYKYSTHSDSEEEDRMPFRLL